MLKQQVDYSASFSVYRYKDIAVVTTPVDPPPNICFKHCNHRETLNWLLRKGANFEW